MRDAAQQSLVTVADTLTMVFLPYLRVADDASAGVFFIGNVLAPTYGQEDGRLKAGRGTDFSS